MDEFYVKICMNTITPNVSPLFLYNVVKMTSKVF